MPEQEYKEIKILTGCIIIDKQPWVILGWEKPNGESDSYAISEEAAESVIDGLIEGVKKIQTWNRLKERSQKN